MARNGAVIGLHWLMGDNVENPEAAKRAAREIALAEGVELPARVSSHHHARSVPEAHSRPALRWLNARRLAWSVARAGRRGAKPDSPTDDDRRHAPSMG